jgi:hypothetical protein
MNGYYVRAALNYSELKRFSIGELINKGMLEMVELMLNQNAQR